MLMEDISLEKKSRTRRLELVLFFLVLAPTGAGFTSGSHVAVSAVSSGASFAAVQAPLLVYEQPALFQ